ncbi:GUN4 domain-containing protein [Sphaerothrix gracilis]|uniref:GUN4 domain-containing protein n=1 Tax=Sphaerothrix gracilis TaxID=3151835 RepID=UPI0031FE39F8
MSFSKIEEILNRIEAKEYTNEDIAALRQLLQEQHNQVFQQLNSKYNIYIEQGQNIHIGDRNYANWNDVTQNDEDIENLVKYIQDFVPPLPKELSRKDYVSLRSFLAGGSWKKANDATRRIILKAVQAGENSWLSDEQVQGFPCQVLKIIDDLWLQYSNSHFGFSVQLQICKESAKDPQVFGDRVGWRTQGNWISAGGAIYSLKDAPTGHLPWGIVQTMTLDNAALNAYVSGLRGVMKASIQQDWQKQLLADTMSFFGSWIGDKIDKEELKRNLEYELSHDQAWWEKQRLEEINVRKLFSLLSTCFK